MDTENHAGLVGGVVFAGGEKSALPSGRGADKAAADGIALGDFLGDEGERGPVGDGPGDADEGDNDGGAGCGADEEGGPGQHGEDDV